jgi:hypothetical protein
MWDKDWGVTHVTAFSKPKPSPGYLTLTPAWNATRNLSQKPPRKKRSDNFKKKDKKFLGNEYTNNRTMSSFLIGAMLFWENWIVRIAMAISGRVKGLHPDHG